MKPSDNAYSNQDANPLLNSVDLLTYGLSPDDPLNDKIYVSCKTSHEGSLWNIDIDQDCPLVALNDKFAAMAKERWGCNVVTVREVASGSVPNVKLLSAGVYLHIEDKIAVLKRDDQAPSYPGAWTEAAGRCGEFPSTTMIKELNEELIFKKDEKNGMVVHAVSDILMETQAKEIRKRQIKTLGLDNARIGDTIFVSEIKGVCGAILRVNGVIKDSVAGDHWFDEKNNTLEICRHVCTSKESVLGLSARDGEVYGRKTGFFTIDELSQLKMTPCLSQFVDNCRHKMSLEQKQNLGAKSTRSNKKLNAMEPQ